MVMHRSRHRGDHCVRWA